MAGKADMVVSITANDMASSALKGLQNNIEQANSKIQTQAKHADALGKNVDKLGYSWQQVTGRLLVAGAGISAVTGFMKSAIQNAIEDEAATSKLAKTMENLGLAYANSGVEDYISKLSLQTGILDDSLRPAMDRILRSTQDVSEAQDAMQLVVDISTSKNRDATDVANTLGKAYDGNVTALGRMGLGIDNAILKSGDMKAITAELSRLYQGQAVEATKTYAGQLTRISTASSEASENVGYSLLAAIESLSNALGGADGAVGLITQMGTNLSSLIDPVVTVSDAFNEFTDSTLGLKGNLDVIDSIFQATVNTMGPATSAWQAWGEQQAAAKKESEATVSEMERVVARAKDIAVAHGFLKPAIDDTSGSWMEYAAAQGAADKEATSLGFATRNLAKDTEKAKTAVENLTAAFDTLNGKTRNSIEAESSMRDAIKQMHGALKESNPALNKQRDGFDLSRESGRKAAGAMNDVASAAESAAKSAADEGKWKKAQRLMDDARAALVKQATQWGMSSSAAQAYIDKIAAIPSVVTTQVFLKTVGQYRPMATGGLVQGPGTGTSDSIPAMLSNGEFIVRASTVNKLGAGFLQMLNSGTMPHFAGGGLVWTPAGGGQFIGGTATNVAGGNYQAGAPASSSLVSAIVQASQSAAAQINADAAYAAAQARADAANAAADFQALVDANLAAQAQAEADRQAQWNQAVWQMNYDIAVKQADALKQAQADAIAAEKDRLAALKTLQETAISAARDTLDNAVQVRNDWARSVAGNAIAFGSITNYTPPSGDNSALNFRAPGTLGAGSAAPAAGDFMGFLAGRLARVRQFGVVIQKLTAAGLNLSTLQEIVSAGPDQGTTLGQAILDAGDIGRINSMSTQLQDVSSAIGANTANTFYGQAVGMAQSNYQSVVAANGGVDVTPIMVTLTLDSQVVATQLLQLKRTQGGISLGLA